MPATTSVPASHARRTRAGGQLPVEQLALPRPPVPQLELHLPGVDHLESSSVVGVGVRRSRGVAIVVGVVASSSASASSSAASSSVSSSSVSVVVGLGVDLDGLDLVVLGIGVVGRGVGHEGVDLVEVLTLVDVDIGLVRRDRLRENSPIPPVSHILRCRPLRRRGS